MADSFLPSAIPDAVADSPQASVHPFLRHLRSLFGARRAPWVIIALALLTSIPMFWVQLDSDDYFQVTALRDDAPMAGIARAPWDLYSFAKDRASNAALREEGVFPWWADLDVRLAFFRPLASVSRALDHALWPHSLFLMQLHSLVWFGLLLAVVARLYQRLLPAPWIAALALFAFAFDEARASTIAWLCNRNALISLALSLAALLFHHRARADGERAARFFAPLCFVLGLLGGETALQVGGYLFAYALFLDRGTRAARVRSLVPYAVIVVAWGALYKALGYGARGSGFYADPIAAPLSFAALVPERLAVYALALFEGVSTDWFDLLPLMGIEPRPYLVPLAAFCLILLVLSLGPLCRRDPLARFWALGAVLAALPACGVRPSDRMLTGAALGGMALLAQLLGGLVERTYPKRVGYWLVGYAAMLALVNLVWAPISRPYFIVMSNDFNQLMTRADQSLPEGEEVADETLVLLNPPWDTFAIFAGLYREAHGTTRPKRIRWLATGVSRLRVTRVDAHALMIAPSDGYLSTPSQQVLRSLDRPIPVGERIALEGVTFEVRSLTDDARPSEVIVRFDEPLEGSSLRFMQWGEHGYVPFVPPRVGVTVEVPAVDIASVLTGA